MKKLLTSFIAIVLFTGALINPVMSQQFANDRATTSADRDMNDGSGKWGLLGLIGLVGLLGTRKKDRTDTFTTSGTPHNR